MGAYRHVGERLRKDLEVVLWTWKEPPQGSRDPRPVLPLEVTSNIENDVIKFRTIASQHQQQQLRPMPGRPGYYRDSPTPTPMNMLPGVGHARPPMMNGPPNPVDVAELMASLQQRTSTPTNQIPSQYQPPPAIRSPLSIPAVPVAQSVPQFSQNPPEYRLPYQALPPTITQPELQQEVRYILQKATIQRMLEPNNVDLQQLIPTLESLKLMLDSEQFEVAPLLQMQAELDKINNRIQSQLSSVLGKSPLNNQQTLPFQPPGSTSGYPRISTPPHLQYAPLPAGPQIPPKFDIASLLSVIQTPPTALPNPATSNLPADNALLSQLRAAGLLPSTPTPEPKQVQPITVSRTSGGLDQNSITQV
jgi:pre-mRNA cleavage complex 2 protein Pcf11